VAEEDAHTSADVENQTHGRNNSDTDRHARTWRKRLGAFVAVIGLVSGVFTIVGAADHWFARLTSDPTCGMSATGQIERSPNLGINFHQNNQVAPMIYVNSDSVQTPLIDVCLSSAPFEIWFPALRSDADVEICTSTTAASFHVNPFSGTYRTYGCMGEGTALADNPYSSGSLTETAASYPAHTEIVGTSAEPAGDGDDKFFVATIDTVPRETATGLKFRAIPMSNQKTDVYLTIYATSNYYAPVSYLQLEHFVLRFR
jgi:hypothetical protein